MAENNLSTQQRRYLQFGVVFALAVFLVICFVFFNKTKSPDEPSVKNTSIYIQDSVLYAFDDTVSLAQYPNRVAMHYPYLLAIQPGEQKTSIYNLEERKKEAELDQALLDYSLDGSLRNDGKTTFFNETDLKVLCDKGYIKNPQEVLCLTKVNPNNVENKLIIIDTTTLKKKDVYVSKNIITDLSFIDGKIYMAELDLYTKKSSIYIDKQKIESPVVVTFFYQQDDKPYFASLKSELNGNVEESYLIEDEKLTKQEVPIYLLH